MSYDSSRDIADGDMIMDLDAGEANLNSPFPLRRFGPTSFSPAGPERSLSEDSPYELSSVRPYCKNQFSEFGRASKSIKHEISLSV